MTNDLDGFAEGDSNTAEAAGGADNTVEVASGAGHTVQQAIGYAMAKYKEMRLYRGYRSLLPIPVGGKGQATRRAVILLVTR